MDRGDLQQLSKEQLIELVLQLQRPDKNSRTSSKPPSTDKKEKRKNSRPGGAKPGHEPHNRQLANMTPPTNSETMCRRFASSSVERCRAEPRSRAGAFRRIRRDRDPAGQSP